jgi:hypothetical protein
MQFTRKKTTKFEPTPTEIREMCLLIQDEWSERERRARAAGSLAAAEFFQQWTVHRVRVVPWE